VLVCEFLVMPRAIEAMLWFNEWLDLDATLRLEEWLSFALLMPVVFGLSFQTPLVMLFAHKIGVVTVEWFREKRRIAWFAMCIFAALITPSVDPVSMLLLWVPMGGLYELGIVMCVYQGGEEEGLAEWEQEEQKSGEIVEV
jgi:sec-independent protein translocase protein TatC